MQTNAWRATPHSVWPPDLILILQWIAATPCQQPTMPHFDISIQVTNGNFILLTCKFGGNLCSPPSPTKLASRFWAKMQAHWNSQSNFWQSPVLILDEVSPFPWKELASRWITFLGDPTYLVVTRGVYMPIYIVTECTHSQRRSL